MFYVVRFFCYISIEYIKMLISLTYSRRNTRLKNLEFFNIKHLIIKRENTMNTTILTQIWSMITVSSLNKIKFCLPRRIRDKLMTFIRWVIYILHKERLTIKSQAPKWKNPPTDRGPWQTAFKCWNQHSEGDGENSKAKPSQPSHKQDSIWMLRFVKGSLRQLSCSWV